MLKKKEKENEDKEKKSNVLITGQKCRSLKWVWDFLRNKANTKLINKTFLVVLIKNYFHKDRLGVEHN